MAHHREPSGPNPILSFRTGIRLTIPELGVLVGLVVAGVMGWMRLDARIARIEEKIAPATVAHSYPVLADPALAVSAP